MILTSAQRKSAERALAAVSNLEKRIEFLEQVASISPEYKERVEALRVRQQYVIELAKLAIAADSMK